MARNCNHRDKDSKQLVYTRHASQRLQQRGIRKKTIDVIVRYGKWRYRCDAKSYFMDKSSRQPAKSGLTPDEIRSVEKGFGCYAVVRDEVVITVGRRGRSFKSH